MKKLIVFLIIFFSFLSSFANHIAGGELFYEYAGVGATLNTSKYNVTMRLFRDCHSTGQTLESERVVIGVYSTNAMSLFTNVTLTEQLPIPSISLNTKAIPCLVNAPEVCFQIGVFTGTVELPNTSDGFTLTWVRCCRIDNIANVSGASIGATFATRIPGQNALPSGSNSSPQFAIKDTALVCQNKGFTLDFGAIDPDGDLLTYSFCDAYSGGSSANPNPGTSQQGLPSVLALQPLPYTAPFTGQSPLGSSVTINSTTGKITGVAPAAGRYVINVCITERRNGIVINEHRKDFILEVGNCDFAASLPMALSGDFASGQPVPVSGAYCKDFKVNFTNSSSSSLIKEYQWDFGVSSSTQDTSSLAEPVFSFPDTGQYKVRLVVKATAGCVDTGYTTLGVYPGFKPDFQVIGSCFQAPFSFNDKTTANYGVVNSWSWNFGDQSTLSDTSNLKNPNYTYSDTGRRNVSLAVTSSKGCKENITKVVAVTDKPFLSLPFKDTLMCGLDTLPINVAGTGTFSWKPSYNILNAGTANPLVFPKITTTYVVTLAEKGCIATDSVKVNVVNAIQAYAGADTSVCATDSIVFRPVSDGRQFHWDPVSDISGSPDTRNAVARPRVTTTYQLTANLGKCEAKDAITVKVAPYPLANAGTDVTICYGKQTQLSASITGSGFRWTPSNSLINSNTLTPIANPTKTTSFILSVTDTLGCPKPVNDTVVVTVTPKVNAFAGNDTTIVADQPLQLNASGGTSYAWSPTTGMNNPSIPNPVVVLNASYDSITYTVLVSAGAGCTQEDDIKVRIFKTAPDIFVPTAFTPNRDGKNDFLKPIPVGMKSIVSFKVYNRWGQLVYSSSSPNPGWDGTLGGKDQSAGTYVFFASGTDYLEKTIIKKGTIVLIR